MMEKRRKGRMRGREGHKEKAKNVKLRKENKM